MSMHPTLAHTYMPLRPASLSLQAILEAAKGCVLVIDEAYGLHAKSKGGSGDPFRVRLWGPFPEGRGGEKDGTACGRTG